MPSQTQTHTVLRSPGPAVDPAFSPSTPDEDDSRGNQMGVTRLDRTAYVYTAPFVLSFKKLKKHKTKYKEVNFKKKSVK